MRTPGVSKRRLARRQAGGGGIGEKRQIDHSEVDCLNIDTQQLTLLRRGIIAAAAAAARAEETASTPLPRATNLTSFCLTASD